MAKKYYVELNKDTCIACGMCPTIAPQIFEMGKVKANLVGVEDKDSGIVSKYLESEEEYKLAQEAAEACPTKSIHPKIIEED